MFRLFYLPLVFLCLVLYCTHAFPWSGEVVRVIDGDTVIVIKNHHRVKIRLSCIDAPERDQPYGKRAKQFLSRLIFGKIVEVEEHGRDRYSRVIADLYLLVDHDKIWINEEMVEEGLAWVYRRYCPITPLLEDESEAHKLKRGLWSQTQPIPPWKWRRR